jgi:hypothetical protein
MFMRAATDFTYTLKSGIWAYQAGENLLLILRVTSIPALSFFGSGLAAFSFRQHL